MIQLTSTSDIVEVIAAGNSVAVTTHASYMDASPYAVTPGRQNTRITTATETTIVSAPAANTQRDLKQIVVHNDNTVGVTVTVQHFDGVSDCVLLGRTYLAPGSCMVWRPKAGWVMINSQGVAA